MAIRRLSGAGDEARVLEIVKKKHKQINGAPLYKPATRLRHRLQHAFRSLCVRVCVHVRVWGPTVCLVTGAVTQARLAYGNFITER